MNRTNHLAATMVFMLIVLAHWGEHLVQAFQIYLLDWPRPLARGLLGQEWPWLVTSEWLHFAYALVMLAALVILRSGFSGDALAFWTTSLVIQLWHFVEHGLLFYQRQSGNFFFGETAPTSIVQLFVQRVELHLFYNAVVTVPMAAAAILYLYTEIKERRSASVRSW